MISKTAAVIGIALSLSGPGQASDTCSTIPALDPSFDLVKLPDPFTFANGSKVTTRDDWECRRNEIISFLQAYEAGTLPPKPPIVSGTFSRNVLNVTAGLSSDNVISFTSSIKFPTGNAPENGWPLLIGLDGGSIPVPAGVAVLTFTEGTIAQQNTASSRGIGLFFDLYGANATASAMTAWTWAISRIIDVLEETPSAQIDTTKIAVTGCSRDGKGALTAGAFEPRIALTIAQESGSGGAACWRLSLYEQDKGEVVQTATEIVQENVWFSPLFDQYVNTLEVLPIDHHLLAALVAPRGLLVFDNTDFIWLSPVSNFGCMSAARDVFTALGVEENLGFMQQGGHAHCAFPANQTSFLDAFFNKFLLGQTETNTSIFVTNGVWNGVEWVPSNWTGWEVPTLA
ncbi:hypothetical protein K488DRAFT_81142 [Vararia minispora EC-137]|uniref:Uncharacterized protein n=1 Tax=Vararia minispora EC-137 TaxID=1314806 RepID=A0ACB8Q868_9AGAM|nr:hypothetical protein K488DRAFT_81142 [Vararia minispora EC-137]